MKKTKRAFRRFTATLLSVMLAASAPAFQLSAFAAETSECEAVGAEVENEELGTETEDEEVGSLPDDDDDDYYPTVSNTAETTSGTTGDCVWMLDEYSGTLTISGNGAMKNYYDRTDYDYPGTGIIDLPEDDGEPWVDLAPWKSYEVLNAVINDGVTNIGDYSFYTLSELTKISISDSVTVIGKKAFSGCSGLTNIVLPDGLKSIGDYAFLGCTGLESIYIPESVDQISKYSFKNCNDLTIYCKEGSYAEAYADENNIPFVTFVDGGKTGDCTWKLDDNGVLTISGNGATADYDDTYNIAPWVGCEFSKLVIEEGVTGVGDFAFGSCQSLYDVSLPDSLKKIGFAAFENCDSLTGITIPKNVTKIEYYAFNYCDNLTSIKVSEDNKTFNSRNNCNAIIEGTELIQGCNNTKIPVWVTKIDKVAFKGCKKLKNAELSYYYYVNSIGFGAFELCESLEDIYIPRNVTSIGNKAFNQCKGLKKATIVAKITDIGQATFCMCSNLEEVCLPDSLKSIGDSAFYNCKKLSKIVIPSSVTSIASNAFTNCNNLTIIGMPGSYAETYANENNIPFESIIDCGITADCFWYVDENKVLTIKGKGKIADYQESDDEEEMYCFPGMGSSYGYYDYLAPWAKHKIVEAVIEDGVTAIGYRAFYGCISMKSISIPDTVKEIGENAFTTCESLTSITIPKQVNYIRNQTFNGCKNLRKVFIPYDAGRVLIFGSNVFYDCQNETIYGIKNHFANIYATNNNIPFVAVTDSGKTGDCVWYVDENKVLTISGVGKMADYDSNNTAPWKNCDFNKVEIEDGVKNIGRKAFSKCGSLTDVTISDSVKTIGENAFEYCGSLAAVSIPDSVTNIGKDAFICCYSLTDIDLPNSVTEISYGTFTCSGLKSITIPDSVTSIDEWAFSSCVSLTDITIPDSVTSISNGAFASCSNLKEVVLPESLTSIDGGVFSNCTGLTKVSIPDSVTSIGSSAFSYCTSLTSIIIPDGVKTIGEWAFADCKGLERITLPDSVTDIDKYAFSGCESLSDVYYIGTEESFNNISIGSNNEEFTAANIHYVSIGDVNLDGALTIRDCTALQRYLAQFQDLTDVQLALADANGDGRVDIRDVTRIQYYLAEFDVVLGKNKTA